MHDQTSGSSKDSNSKVLPFPFTEESLKILSKKSDADIESEVSTPASDELMKQAALLDKVSRYRCKLDYSIYRNLEKRFAKKPIRGGIYMKTAFRLVNSHSTCQQCLYAFEIDTYGRGCVHDCVYCYAKAQLTVHGYWNKPIPVPINFNEIRKAFYNTFETDKKHKWRELLERKIPLRIGSMSDSFMWSDTKYKVTQELLRLLKYYEYPYVIFTRSDLVAHDDYIKLMDPKLAAIQFSISSVNEDLIRKIEPGAPSASRRLKALEKLASLGYWTTVRLNPLFPIHPDGFFTNPRFNWDGPVPKFDYSSFEMIDAFAAHKVPAVLCGFVRFSRLSLNAIERATSFNLREFYDRSEVNKSSRDFHYSDKEIRFYYEEFKRRCTANGIEFTTCYIGNGEGHFWKDQDLWSNKKDCCNAKSRVTGFVTDARSVPFESRLKYVAEKSAAPLNPNTLHAPLGEAKRDSKAYIIRKRLDSQEPVL